MGYFRNLHNGAANAGLVRSARTARIKEFELSRRERFDALLFRKGELSKSNSYYHSIPPIEAAEVDAKLAEAAAAAAAKKKAAAEAEPAAPASAPAAAGPASPDAGAAPAAPTATPPPETG